MRNLPWRFALTAALACLLPASLKATESAGAAPASHASSTTESPEPKSSDPAPAQPAVAAPEKIQPTRPPAPDFDSLGRMLGYLTFFAALAGGALYFIKFGLPLRKGLASDRKLQVLETRPLGNKQYLLVVGYEDTRMLLGVTPGKIDYLCPLDSTTAPADFSTMMGSVENQAPRS